MRVLWLCNIMLPMIAEHLHMEASNKEGWLSGLANACLKRQDQNAVELAVAFPVSAEFVSARKGGTNGLWADETGMERHICDGNVVFKGQITYQDALLRWYAFMENTSAPHQYDERLEYALHYITADYRPDVVHCFGTEYPHTLAMCRAFPDKNRILIGIQGLCKVYADAYFADLPESVIRRVTLRDILKRDSLRAQQRKFVLRGEMEYEAVRLAGNVTGRTAWDKYYTGKWNPEARYFMMNETLRPDFYMERWKREDCEPHSIFLSQGDYPIKGLHYMLLALPRIREAFPDVKVYVAGNSIIGDGSLYKRLKISAYGRYLRRLMWRYRLQDTVCFLGRLSAEQMKKQYLKSNLFVCCSSIENSPNSLGEAMLLGMPCVSADVGGISSIFTDGEDGILYKFYDKYVTPNQGVNLAGGGAQNRKMLEVNVMNLSNAVIRMFSSDERQLAAYTEAARTHALRTHDPETNYEKLMEIYTEITKREKSQERFVFVSNYINHHQIPFCNAMYEKLGDAFVFIQTQPMEEERVRMGWQEQVELPYLKYYYEEPEKCGYLIDTAATVLFGGVDDERYIENRLRSGRPVIRYSERLYKEGQWKAISPRGLLKKYHDHTRYRNAPVWLLCSGAYVPSDFHIVRAYPGKMYKWGYFPETRHYDVDELMSNKKPATILWAARFLDWKHPETALKCAAYLKEKGCRFHMNIVGGGQMQPLVDRLMKEYALEDVVTLLGFRKPEEVRALMEETDIYLATSDRKEGWGAVINEAMNSGCAVVADHMMGAAPYLIRPGENGFVYEDGRERQLFEQVATLLSDRALCQRIGREAYHTIMEEWNAETAAERLLDFCARQGIYESAGSRATSAALPDRDMAQQTPQDGPCAPAPVISERKMLWNMEQQTHLKS